MPPDRPPRQLSIRRRRVDVQSVDRVQIRTDQDYAKALTICFQKRAKQIRH